jgi:CO/xanthine dehydrogenase Mo-binding subunit
MKDAIGQPVPRKEDPRLITGRGTYVSDLQPPRTRHVAFLRSPHAHARIGAIDVSQAREPEVPVHDEAPDNVLLTRTFAAGDAEAAFAAADLIVERELITNRHAGNPMECRAGLALWQPERRRLTFWSSTQVPHIIRNIVAELLSLPENSVRVIAPDVGGAFGVKAGLYPEDVALCLMARALPGTPVKWVEDRGEHLLAACHARDHRYLMKAGFTRDGGLLALRADITCNAGAYSGYPWTAGIEPLMAGGLLSGPYRLANYDCTVRGVATNTAPAGPYRGVARPASVFAMESVIDSAARALDLSGEQIRRRNFIRPEDIPYRMPSRLAGQAVRDRALRLAAGLLDAKADELALSGGQIFVNGDEQPSLSLAEVGRVAYLESNRLPEGIEPGLEETRFYDPIRGAFAAGAQVVRIEIDPTRPSAPAAPSAAAWRTPTRPPSSRSWPPRPVRSRSSRARAAGGRSRPRTCSPARCRPAWTTTSSSRRWSSRPRAGGASPSSPGGTVTSAWSSWRPPKWTGACGWPSAASRPPRSARPAPKPSWPAAR